MSYFAQLKHWSQESKVVHTKWQQSLAIIADLFLLKCLEFYQVFSHCTAKASSIATLPVLDTGYYLGKSSSKQVAIWSTLSSVNVISLMALL